MSRITSVILPNAKRDSILSNMLDLKGKIEAFSSERDKLLEEFEKYIHKKELIEYTLSTLTPEMGLPAHLIEPAIEYKTSRMVYLTGFLKALDEKKELIDDKQKKINSFETAYQKYEEKLSTLPEDRVLTLTELRDRLKNFQNIVKKSITLGYSDVHQRYPYIAWSYRNILTVPDMNRYLNIEKAPFKLGEIRVSINLGSMKIKMMPKQGTSRLLPISYEGARSGHPHILTNNNPCLGDFHDNIIEAIADMEFENVATILQMFLEQSYNGDSAGQFWPRYNLVANAKGLHIDFIDDCMCYEISNRKDNSYIHIYGRMIRDSTDQVKYLVPHVTEKGTIVKELTKTQIQEWGEAAA